MRHLLIAACTLLFALPALAQPNVGEAAEASRKETSGVAEGNTIGLKLIGGGLGLAAGFAGFQLAESQCGDRLLCGGRRLLYPTLIGGATTLFWQAGLIEEDSGLAGAAAGAGAGMLVTVALIDSEERDWILVGSLASIGIGAGVGYFVGDRLGDSGSTPNVSVVPDGQGGAHYAAGLSGRF